MSTETHNNAHALDALQRYNAWRRDTNGWGTMDDYDLSPREIGHAVDVAVAVLDSMQWHPIETIPEDRQVLVKFPCMRREVPCYVVSCWHDPDLSNGRGLVNTFGELSMDTADADGWMEIPDI